MQITCPHCNKHYVIDESKLSSAKNQISMPCKICKGVIPIQPEDDLARFVEMAAKFATGEALKKQIIKTVKDLPPMPQVAQKARDILADPNSSISELAKVIATDQGIATRVLKLANSSYYGISGKVSSVQHASVVLGTSTLMELVTLACSQGFLSNSLAGYELETGDFWQHSLAVAAASQAIAKKCAPGLEQDAFSAGLVHDVGKLILDPYILERKKIFDEFIKIGKRSFLDAEKTILGFDHAEMAADLCSQWQLPTETVDAIRFHHEPADSKGSLLTNILHAADVIALMSGIGAGMDGLLYKMDDDAMAMTKLDDVSLTEVMAQAVLYVAETSEQL